jgi:hypothetical protein
MFSMVLPMTRQSPAGKDKDSAKAVVPCAVYDGKSESGQDFESDDRSGGSADWDDFDDAGEGVEGEDQEKGAGCAPCGRSSCREQRVWHRFPSGLKPPPDLRSQTYELKAVPLKTELECDLRLFLIED